MHTYRRAAERIKPAGAPATHSAAKATRCALVPRVITSCFLDLLPHSACSPLIYWWQSHVVISFAFSVSSLTSHLSPSQHFSRVRSPALLLSLARSLARVLAPFLLLFRAAFVFLLLVLFLFLFLFPFFPAFLLVYVCTSKNACMCVRARKRERKEGKLTHIHACARALSISRHLAYSLHLLTGGKP